MKIIINFLIILFINYVISIRIEKEDPIVNLPNLGKLRGREIQTAWSHRTVYQFVDIKYAETTSGENRFKPPIPIKPWNGIREATSDGFGCPSVFALNEFRFLLTKKLIDFEDCLSMTITTPNLTGNYPVVVYLHGEFLYEGNNLEGSPEYMLEKDIILVSPQYRLGPFGFLSTKTSDIPGNVGVLDVIMALHWIKYFIMYFGGDPNRVTIMGQVGGAAIAHLLTLSPIVDNDLFHQVILQSGSAIMPLFLTDEPEKYAIDIGYKSGCINHNNFIELNNCLHNLTVVELLEGFALHIREHSPMGVREVGGIKFTIGGPSPILPVHPLFIGKNNRKLYPTMGGTTKNVGTRALKGIIQMMIKNYIFDIDFDGTIPDSILNGADYISHILFQTQGFDDTGILTTMLINKFFTPELIQNGTFQVLLPGLIDLTGTIVHKIPTLLALNRNAKLLPNQTFLYSFDYRGQFNRYPDFDDDFDYSTPFLAGVTLTDENIYLFPYPEHVDHLNVIDEQIAKNMIELWTSFIINGKPIINNINNFEWPSMIYGLNGPYLKIDNDEMMKIGNNYHDEFMATINDELNGISLVRSEFFKSSSDEYLKKLWKKKFSGK